MAKKLSIEEKKAELNRQMRRINCIEALLEYCENQVEWNMVLVRDENDECIVDEETGRKVMRAPQENEWGYNDYIAWTEMVEELSAMF